MSPGAGLPAPQGRSDAARPPGNLIKAGIDPADLAPSVHAGGAVMWIGGAAIMLVLLLVTFFAWTRETRPSGGLGWLESARRASLAAVVSEGAAPGSAAALVTSDTGNVDEDDKHLAAYNAYLARLNAAPDRDQAERRPPAP